MKEILLVVGWIIAFILFYVNYTQAKQINSLKERLNTAEASRKYDHEAYRQILKDFAGLVSNANAKKNVVERVDAMFDSAFKQADESNESDAE